MTNNEFLEEAEAIVGRDYIGELKGTQQEMIKQIEIYLENKEFVTKEDNERLKELDTIRKTISEEIIAILTDVFVKLEKTKFIQESAFSKIESEVNFFAYCGLCRANDEALFRGGNFELLFDMETMRLKLKTVLSNLDVDSRFMKELEFFNKIVKDVNIEIDLYENTTEEDAKIVTVRYKGKIKRQMKFIEVKSLFKRSNLDDKISNLRDGDIVKAGVLTYKLN
jgi:hypothetical protein